MKVSSQQAEKLKQLTELYHRSPSVVGHTEEYIRVAFKFNEEPDLTFTIDKSGETIIYSGSVQ